MVNTVPAAGVRKQQDYQLQDRSSEWKSWSRQCQLVGATAKGKFDHIQRKAPDEILGAPAPGRGSCVPRGTGYKSLLTLQNQTGWDHQDLEVVSAVLLWQDLLHSRFYHGSRSSWTQLCNPGETARAVAGGEAEKHL